MVLNFFKPKFSKRTLKIKRKKGLLFFNPSPLRILVFSLGTGLFLTSLTYLIFLYIPLTTAYLNYRLGPRVEFVPPALQGLPVEKINYNDFFIEIPKLKASSQVFPNVPADNKEVYLVALQKGVAHAAGTGFPGEGKTIFLFAHSTNSPYNFVRYNAVFMLLNNLKVDDKINLYFSEKTYIYNVTDKKIVKNTQTDLVTTPAEGELLLLQTCWPPGTTWNRLIIFARPYL